MKKFLILFLCVLASLPALAAQVTIGQLPLLDPSSTNAYVEIEDQSASPRSRKAPYGTVPQLTVYGTPGGSNYIGGTLDVLTNINVRPIGANGTNGTYSILYHPSFTVANLFTPPASSFPVVYCSDAVTSRGTGAYVRWDGSSWMTWENVVATSDIKTYILYARQSGLNTFTSISDVVLAANANWISGYPGFSGSSANGGGFASGSFFNTTYGNCIGFSTGGANNGQGGGYATQVPQAAAGEYWSVGAGAEVNTLCSVGDTYYVKFGIDAQAGSPINRLGAYFLYDMFGINQTTLGSLNYTNIGIGAVSNNWLAVTGTAGANTVQDTGIPVSATAPNVLVVVVTSTAAYFYIDGVLKNTIGTTLPNASCYGPTVGIVKTVGTNERRVRIFNMGQNFRHGAYTFQ